MTSKINDIDIISSNNDSDKDSNSSNSSNDSNSNILATISTGYEQESPQPHREQQVRGNKQQNKIKVETNNRATVFVKKHAVEIKAKFQYVTSYGVRVCALIFFTNLFLSTHRVNLKVAITCVQGVDEAVIDFGKTIESMTTQQDDGAGGIDFNKIVQNLILRTTTEKPLETASDSSVFLYKTRNSTDFSWNDDEISFLLSSFYYGSFLAQIPGGYLSYRFGEKHVITVAIVISSICSLLTPVAAREHIVFVFLIRIALGVAWGLCSPALYSTIVNWTLTKWRASVLAVVSAGKPLGLLVSFLTARDICRVGWDVIFYLYGCVTLAFVAVWLYEGYTSPRLHPRISKPELEYLTQKLQVTEEIKPEPKPPTPWKRLLLSRVHWATTFAHFVRKWSYFSLIYSIPQFMFDVLDFNIKKSGLISTLPYFFGMLSMLASGKLSTIVIEKTKLKLLTTRKVFTSISFIITATCLTSIGHVTPDIYRLSVFLMCITSISIELAFGGYISAFADFAGVFSGTSYAIANAFADTSLTIMSLTAGILTTHDRRNEWQYNFYIASGLCVLAAGIYCIVGDTTLQEWAKIEEPSETATNDSSEPLDVQTDVL